MDAPTVLQRAQAAHLRLVRFLYCDNGGIIRGKATMCMAWHIVWLKALARPSPCRHSPASIPSQPLRVWGQWENFAWCPMLRPLLCCLMRPIAA